jgi:hypothetical protein
LDSGRPPPRWLGRRWSLLAALILPSKNAEDAMSLQVWRLTLVQKSSSSIDIRFLGDPTGFDNVAWHRSCLRDLRVGGRASSRLTEVRGGSDYSLNSSSFLLELFSQLESRECPFLKQP